VHPLPCLCEHAIRTTTPRCYSATGVPGYHAVVTPLFALGSPVPPVPQRQGKLGVSSCTSALSHSIRLDYSSSTTPLTLALALAHLPLALAPLPLPSHSTPPYSRSLIRFPPSHCCPHTDTTHTHPRLSADVKEARRRQRRLVELCHCCFACRVALCVNTCGEIARLNQPHVEWRIICSPLLQFPSCVVCVPATSRQVQVRGSGWPTSL
jgi:hypothetical protein